MIISGNFNSAFDSIPDSITARALANNFSKEELERRETAEKNKDFYYSDSEKYVTTFNTDQIPMTFNITKPIVSKRASLLYPRKLVREIIGPSRSIDVLQQVWVDNDIDLFLSTVDLMAELTGTVLVFPSIREDGSVKLVMWDGGSISVLQDENDPTKAVAISLVKVVDRLLNSWQKTKEPQNERIIYQQIWTEDSVVTYEGSTLVKSETTDFGFVPFARFCGEELSGQYVGAASSTITRKTNHYINQILTDLAYIIRLQAATPVAISGWAGGDELVISPGRALSLPAGATASVLNLNPKIQEVLSVLEFLEKKAYELSSVPQISVIGGEGQSGRELLIRWYPLVNVMREKARRFERYEFELANLILRLLGEEPIEEMIVHYPDVENLPLSPQEENLERDIVLNLKSPVDEMMRRNPNLSREEAMQEIQKRIRENTDLGLSLIAEGIGNPQGM